MRPAKDRNLSLTDVMILVAATALGCSLVSWAGVKAVVEQGNYLKYRYNYSVAFGLVVNPVWLTLTFAALIIRLRSPRPSFRRLARQPGLVASLSVSLAAPISLAIFLLEASNFRWRLGMPIPSNYFGRLPFVMSWVVFGAWLALALNRRWRPVPSSIDRLGRLLGAGWLGFYLLEIACSYFFYP
jgi:hypothetical protein